MVVRFCGPIQTGPEADPFFSSMCNGPFQGGKRPECGAGHPRPSSADLRIGCSCTFTSHLCRHRHVMVGDLYQYLYPQRHRALSWLSRMTFRFSSRAVHVGFMGEKVGMDRSLSKYLGSILFIIISSMLHSHSSAMRRTDNGSNSVRRKAEIQPQPITKWGRFPWPRGLKRGSPAVHLLDCGFE